MKNSDIKGVDVLKGLAVVAGNKAIYLRLLKSFISNSFCDKIIEAIAAGDSEQISHSAHSLKGVAGNMHMAGLYEYSRQIEAIAKEGGNLTVADEVVVNLIDENSRTTESVSMLMDNPGILDTLQE